MRWLAVMANSVSSHFDWVAENDAFARKVQAGFHANDTSAIMLNQIAAYDGLSKVTVREI